VKTSPAALHVTSVWKDCGATAMAGLETLPIQRTKIQVIRTPPLSSLSGTFSRPSPVPPQSIYRSKTDVLGAMAYGEFNITLRAAQLTELL
jgi:hypothetical protein